MCRLLFLRIVLRQFTQSPTNLTTIMTSTIDSSIIDFSRVFLEKIQLLIDLTHEDNHPTREFSEEERKRYIQLRKQIAKILNPLFEDLELCEISSIADVLLAYPGE